MYCRKCGKQIDDGSKFCPYCGGGVKEVSEDEWGDEWQEDTLTETGQEKKSLKKWLIPVGVLAGIAVVTTVGALAMNLSKSESVGKKAVTEQKATPKKQEEPKSVKEPESNTEVSTPKGGTEETVEEAAYPKEITLDMEVQNKIIEFVHLLGLVDCRMSGGDGITLGKDRIMNSKGSPYFAYSFLYMSLHTGVPFVEGHKLEYPRDYSQDGRMIVSTEIVDNYLQNSINTTDYSYQSDNGHLPYEISQEIAYFHGYDPNSMWSVEEPIIQKIKETSNKDIQIEGYILYSHPETGDVNSKFQITMTANPNSMWGGYTLKEINSWGEGTSTTGDYVLPDIATRYYSENELSSMDAHTLYLARNELYARHGYIFNNADLKEYFGVKPWYEPTTTTVPDSAFNEYEKANLQLIQTLEE